MRDRIAIIDINTKKFKAISYKQYDENNILQIVITENGNIIGLSNYSAVVKFQLPSGVVYKIPSIIENNTIKLILTRAILSEYGKVIVEIVLQDTKQLITTFSIYLNVEKSINNENSQLPEMDITSDYLHRHENKEVLDQITQEMIDSILEFEELLELDVYATKDYVQSEIEKIDINTDNLDLSNYYTKEEVDEKFENIDINTDNIDLSNYATKEELPTKASQLENDLNYLTSIPEEYVTETELNTKGYLTEHQDISGKADKSELFSKDYNDLINKPNIPSLDGYATEAYVKNEIANAQLGGGDTETDLSGFATKDELNNKADINDIPTKVSQLENDSNYLTSIPEEYITNEELNNKGYLTEHQDISGKADKSDIPTKTSQLNNDSGYLTSVPSEYITETELNEKGYLTEHQDISNKANKSDIPTKTSQLTNDNGFITTIPSEYITESELNTGLSTKANKSDIPSLEGLATETYVQNKIAEAQLSGEEVDLSGYATKDELKSKADIKHTHTMSNITDLVIPDVDKAYVDTQLNTKANKSDIPNLDGYALKTDIPTVPTKVSDLTNDSGYITEVPSEYITEIELNEKGFLTEHQDISGKADKSEIPTKTSQLTNDSNFLTSVPSEYVTETELESKGYLTEHQSLEDYALKTELPTKTSQLTNDSGYLTEHQNISGKADKSYVDTELAKKSDKTHAHSYNDLSDKPDIPSVDGLATKKELTDGLATKSDTGHTHDQYLTEHQDLSDYALKSEIPTVPTKTSQLTNDSNFISSIPEEYVTETELNAKGYLTEHQNISGKADKSDIPTKTSQLTNDSGYLTSVPSEYITETELNEKGYATTEELNAKADIDDIPTKVSQLTNDSNFLTSVPSEYVTKEELNNKGYLTSVPSEYITETELNNKGYLTEHQDISHLATKDELNNKADKSSIPTKVSQLENDSKFLTSVPSEYITESELEGKGYLTNIPEEYVTDEELEESLANKFDNVEVNKTETNDTQTALDFYANGKVVKTVYFTGGGNANTPPYVTLLSVEDNILGLGEVFNLELDFLSGVTGKGTLKVFINDIEVVSKSIPQGENTIPITDDNFIKGNNRMTLYVIDRASTMSNSVTLYVRYGSSGIVKNEIARYTTSDGNTFPIFNGEFTYTYAITNSDGVYEYSIMTDSMDNLPTSISFNGKSNLLTVEYLNTSNVTSMVNMFQGCKNLTSLDLSNFNTSKATNMGNMFQNCSNLTKLDVSNFNTKNVTSMNNMFQGCKNLTSLDVSNFDTSKVTNMRSMFNSCNNLTKLDVSNFDTSNVTDMNNMFQYCNKLTSLDLSNFDTSKVTNMQGMFNSCKNLTSLDLSNFDTSKVTNMNYMFNGCTNLFSLDSMQNILVSLSLSSTILNQTSLVDVINNLKTVTTTRTLTLGTTLLAKLTEEQIAVAVNKGWTVE